MLSFIASTAAIGPGTYLFTATAAVIGPGTLLFTATAAFIAGIAAWAALSASVERRQLLTVAGMITLVVAIPVTRVPSSGELLALISVGLIGLGVVGYPKPGSRTPRGLLLVATLMVLLVFVSALSPDQGATIRLLSVAAATVPIYAVVGRSRGDVVRRISRLLVTIALGQSALALVEPFLFPAHLWAPAQIGSLGQIVPLLNPLLGNSLERSQGTMGHPLTLGLLLLIGIALLSRSFPAAPLQVRLGATAFLLLGLVASGSRNSLIIAVVVLLFMGRSLTPVRALVGSLVAILGLGLAVNFSLLTSDVREDFADSGSFTHRVGAYEAIGRLMSDQPVGNVMFGNGLASSPRLFDAGLLQTDGFNVVDNQFALILAQGGILALLGLLAIVIAALLFAPRAIRPVLLALVATMLIFDVLTWPSSTVLAFFVFAASMNPDSIADAEVDANAEAEAALSQPHIDT